MVVLFYSVLIRKHDVNTRVVTNVKQSARYNVKTILVSVVYLYRDAYRHYDSYKDKMLKEGLGVRKTMCKKG